MSKPDYTKPFMLATVINRLSQRDLCKPVKISGWKQLPHPKYKGKTKEDNPIVWWNTIQDHDLAGATEIDRDAAWWSVGQWGSGQNITVGEVYDDNWMYVIGSLEDPTSPHKHGFSDCREALSEAVDITLQRIRNDAQTRIPE